MSIQPETYQAKVLLNDNVALSLTELFEHDAKKDSIRTLQVKNVTLGAYEDEFYQNILQPQTTLQSLSLIEVGLSASSIRKLILPAETLQYLDLSNNPKIGPRGAKSLADHVLSKCERMQHLNLDHTALSHFGAQAIGAVLPSSLIFLSLSNNQMGFDGAWKLSQRLSLLTSLQTLHLAHNNIADDGCLEIAQHIPQLQSLQDVDLSYNDIGDTGMSQLAQVLPQATMLSHCNVSHNRISDESAVILGQVLPKTQLTQLNLSYNTIGDDGCVEIAQGLSSPHLLELDLSYNQIGDEGAGELVERLDHVPQMHRLSLEGNEISEARTRILDLLLKHRTPRAAPRNSSAMLGLLETPKDNSNREDDTLVFPEEERMIDQNLIEEGRDILTSMSLESNELADLPYDYIVHSTSHFTTRVSYGAMGVLFSVHDKGDNFLEQVNLLVRRAVLAPPGPLETVRDHILNEEMVRFAHLQGYMPLIAHSSNNHTHCFVYDATDCRCLRELLVASPSEFTWPRRLQLLESLSAAVARLHTSDKLRPATFHGDLSPDTIHVHLPTYTARILDCGLARLIGTDRPRFAPKDVVFGSRGYRCPRYERGSTQYDTASDIFALGTIVAEIMTGNMQGSNNGYDVYYDTLMGKRALVCDPVAGEIPNTVMETLAKVVLACMSPSFDQRPTAQTVHQILESLSL